MDALTPASFNSIRDACNAGLYCINGGFCHYTAENQTASCECPPMFSGTRCELPALMLFPCADEDNNCMNGGQCVMERRSGNSLCLCPSGFDGYRCQSTNVVTGAMDERDATNLRFYTIIGIILACCALVGIAAMTVIKTRNHRRKKQSKKRSKKSDPEKGEKRNEQELSPFPKHSSSLKKASSTEGVASRTESSQNHGSRKASREKQFPGVFNTPHQLNRHSSEPKYKSSSLSNSTHPLPHPPTQPATPPARRQARMADLTEQLLNSRSHSRLLHGSESCLHERSKQYARNGSVTGLKSTKHHTDSNGNLSNKQRTNPTKTKSSSVDVPTIQIGAAEELDKLLPDNE